MSVFTHIASSLLESATAHGSRSTVVRPLLYLMVASLVALLTSLPLESPMWIQIILAGVVVCSLCFFIGMYWYFSRKQPDALRSETFALQRQLIERGLVGDSNLGKLVDIAGSGEPEAIAGADVKKIEST